MVCVFPKWDEFIQLCKVINAGFHGGTSHFRPLAFESVWNHLTHCIQKLKIKYKCIVVKKIRLARILCMRYVSAPSCTSTVKSSRRHQRTCERKASAFADTEHTTASDSLFTPERDWALLFHLYLHPTGRLIRNRKPPDVLLNANAGNFTCSFFPSYFLPYWHYVTFLVIYYHHLFWDLMPVSLNFSTLVWDDFMVFTVWKAPLHIIL